MSVFTGTFKAADMRTWTPWFPGNWSSSRPISLSVTLNSMNSISRASFVCNRNYSKLLVFSSPPTHFQSDISGILAKNEINHLKALFPNCRSPLSEKILKEISEKSEISQEQNCCCYISLHNAEKYFVIIIKTVTVTRSMQGACHARQHCSQHALCGTGSMVQNVKRRVQPS